MTVEGSYSCFPLVVTQKTHTDRGSVMSLSVLGTHVAVLVSFLIIS